MHRTSPGSAAPKPRLFPPALRAAVLAALFTAAFAVRMSHITDPPLDFHPTRQFHSIFLAQRLYRQFCPASAAHKPEFTAAQKPEGMIEPPVMELIAVAGYRCAGGERLWIPRAVSSVLWLIGGVFLYPLSKRISSPDAAIASVALYLFLPFGIAASRSFQPDPLMVMLLVASLWAVMKYHDAPSQAQWVLAAAISGAALFAKPVALFPIAGAYAGLELSRRGVRRGAMLLPVTSFTVVILAPSILYYAWGKWTGLIPPGTEAGRFLPHIVFQRSFWERWRSLVILVFGSALLLVALAGLAAGLRRGGPARGLLAGAWLGYLLYCTTFSYHTSTHDYYHLPLIPIVALSLAPLADLLIRAACRAGLLRFIAVAGTAALAFGVFHGIRVGRHLYIRPGSERVIRIAREIGKAVTHSQKTIFLAEAYGQPLIYYGEFDGRWWPATGDLWADSLRGVPPTDIRERLQRMESDSPADYFIVTWMDNFDAQPDLTRFLTKNFPLLVKTDEYLIFDLRNSGGPKDRQRPAG